MRRLKLWTLCHPKTFLQCCFSLCLSVFLLLLAFSSPASALNLSNTGDMWIDTIQYERGIYGTTSWSLNTVSPPALTEQLQWSFSINNMSVGNEISRLYIKYKSEPSGPALISFDISYYIESPNSAFTPIYNGLKFKNRYVLLNDSCINSVGVPMTYTTKNTYTFECSYLVYASSTTSRSIDTEAGSPIFSAPGTNNNLTMRIGPANYVEVSNNGLSADDRTWLESVLPQGSPATPAQIEQAIIDAQEQSRQNERNELDNEADCYLDDINNNTDQQAIDNKMTSIFSVIQNFVTAVIHPVISTCILPMDFRNYTGMGFYEVDLCYLSPPSGVTEVLNVIFIFFVLGLAYSAIRSVISMYKEVIDG